MEESLFNYVTIHVQWFGLDKVRSSSTIWMKNVQNLHSPYYALSLWTFPMVETAQLQATGQWAAAKENTRISSIYISYMVLMSCIRL